MDSKTEDSGFTFLPYDLPYMTDELKKRAEVELFENEEVKRHSLKSLRILLKEEKNLNFQDEDEFLLLFLRTKKYDLNRSFKLIKTFYSVKVKHNELYGCMTYEHLSRTVADGSVYYLPYRNDDGCVILMLIMGAWNTEINSHGDLMRLLTAGLFHTTRSPATQVAGIKVIVDAKNFGAKKLKHISPTYLWLFTEALQNCFPARFKGIHIVNENALFAPIWTIMKQFINKKLADRFHFHGKNFSKLHKHLNPKVLPEEYGGELPPYSHTEWAEKFLQSVDYQLHVSSFGYDKPDKK